METSDIWRLDERRATVDADGFRATLDLTSSGQGLVVTSYLDQALAETHVLGVAPAHRGARLRLIDHYVRGRDLIAVYTLSPGDTTRVEVYWQLIEPGVLSAGCVGVDLRVSVQTALLDSSQEIETVSRMPAAESLDVRTPDDLHRPHGCVLFRPRALDASYAQIIHPADYVSAELKDDAGQHAITASLFATRLEKGVILRARVRGVIAPRNTDRECALAAYREFITEPPPLTT